MVVMFGFAHGNDTAVGDFAFDVLELNGSVDHAEVVVQDFFHVAQDALAG